VEEVNDLTVEQRATLEVHGAALAARLEAEGPNPDDAYDLDNLPLDVALRLAAIQRAVAIQQSENATRQVVERARAEGYSWHKIAVPLGITAEGARRKFA